MRAAFGVPRWHRLLDVFDVGADVVDGKLREDLVF